MRPKEEVPVSVMMISVSESKGLFLKQGRITYQCPGTTCQLEAITIRA